MVFEHLDYGKIRIPVHTVAVQKDLKRVEYGQIIVAKADSQHSITLPSAN